MIMSTNVTTPRITYLCPVHEMNSEELVPNVNGTFDDLLTDDLPSLHVIILNWD